MNNKKLRVTRPANKLSFMQIGDIITHYTVAIDNFHPPMIIVNTNDYAEDNKFEQNGRFMWWAGESFYLGFENVEVIEEGEIKMKKFKLKSPKYSFDHEGMIIEGKPRSCEHKVDVYAIDLCDNNIDIMSKKNIIQCMCKGNDFTWKYDLDELEPIEVVKMTRLDYEMLEFIQKQGAKYVCRDKNGTLNIYEHKPYQNEDEEGIWWSVGKVEYLSEFVSKLFQFVTWENQKYYVIEDVLKYCEVIEDENDL